MKNGKYYRPIANQQGVALLEALISVLILAFGILALVGLQTTLLKQTTQSRYRSEASYLANQLEGQMWADMGTNSTLSALSAYNGCANTKCTAIAASAASKLPNGAIAVVINGSDVTITVTWRAPDETTSNQHVVNTSITPSVM